MKKINIVGIVILLLVILSIWAALYIQSDYKVDSCNGQETEGNAVDDNGEVLYGKPVIYVYPEEEMRVSLKLDFKGDLTCTYPEHDKDWDVMAYPDGTLVKDGREYSYLFWEGISDKKWDITEGNIVKGSETKDFLEHSLKTLGLTDKEANDFITYWLPQMKDNKYNLIHFADEEYHELAKLSIKPSPEKLIRVFMVYKQLDSPIQIDIQELKTDVREGYTVVEWGGVEIE